MSSSAAEQKALEEFFTSHAVGELSKDKKSMITIEKRATVEVKERQSQKRVVSVSQ